MAKNINKLDEIFETDIVSNTRIEIFDQKRIVVEGCYGIKEFSEDVVQINLPKGTLIVFGSNLLIALLSGKSVTLSGKILSVQFEVNL